MANNIDLIFSQNAIKSIDDVIAKLNTADAELANMGKTIKDINKAFNDIKAPGSLSKLSDDIGRIDAAMKQNAATVKALETQISSLQAKVNAGTTSTNNATNATTRNTQATNQATTATNALGTAQGNQTRQTQAQRTGFNSLSNSINQLTREAPAFGNSMQTGLMAISNNIGPLVDGLEDTRRKVADMNAEFARTGQGQATSMWKEISKSLFSFNTLISVGITLLVLYGKEVFELAFGLSEAEKAQKALNDSIDKNTVLTTNQITSLKEHQSIMNDTSQTVEERRLAELNLRDALEDANLLDEGKVVTLQQLNALTNEYIESLTKRAKWEAYIGEIAKLSMERDLLQQKNKLSPDAFAEYVDEIATAGQKLKAVALAARTGSYRIELTNIVAADLEKQIIAKTKAIKGLEEQLKGSLEFEPDKEKAKSTGNKQEQKVQEEKVKQQHEFNVQELENIIKFNETVLKNEEASDNDRLVALETYYDAKEKLIAENLKYSQYAAAFDTRIELQALNDKIKSGKMSARELAEAQNLVAQKDKELKIELEKIEKDAINKSLENQSYYNIEYAKIRKFNEADLRKHFDVLIEIEEVAFKKELQELEKQKTDTLKLTNLTQEEQKHQTDIANHNILEAQRKHNIELKKLEISKLTGIIELNKAHVEKYGAGSGMQQTEIDAILRQIDLLREGITKLESEATASPTEIRIRKITEALNELFTSKAFEFLRQNQLGSLIANFFEDVDKQIPGVQTRFEKLIKSMQEGGKNTVATFALIAESMADLTKTIISLQDDNIEEEKAALEERYQTALKFAGLSEEGKKAIEEDYARRSKEIKIKEWKAKNQASQDEIVMNTLVAITQALTQPPPYSFILAGIVAALGAAQLAQVKSLQMPAFAEGGIHTEGGLALVNDGKGSNYKETIVTPSGSIFQPKGRNVVMDLPKGTEIFTNEQWKDKAIQGMFNGKELNVNQNFNGGLTSDQLDSVIGKHFAKITTQSVSFDANGIRQWVSNGHNKTIRTEARGSGLGYKV